MTKNGLRTAFEAEISVPKMPESPNSKKNGLWVSALRRNRIPI